MALRSITLSVAEIIGIDHKVGSLESGKDATLFISNGDPLEIRTNVLQAYIQGRKIDMNDRHKTLYNKIIVARDHGAGGILFMNRFQTEDENNLRTLQYRQSSSTVGLPVIQITHSLADEMLIKHGQSIAELRSKLDEQLTPLSFTVDCNCLLYTSPSPRD